MKRFTSFGSRAAACAVSVTLAACAGARHRKVAGPPPEYERPDDPGAREPNDGGVDGRLGEGAASNAPTFHSHAADGPAGSDAGFMLISPDGR